LASLQSAKTELKMKSELGDRIEVLTKDIESQVAADDAKSEEKMAQAAGADAAALRDGRKKCAALVGQYRFAEAKTAAQEAKVTGDKHQLEHRVLVAHMDALAKFKRSS
jgi:hypothetical protein